MKRTLLILAAALLLLTTVAPNVVWADGGPAGTNCGGGVCKP